MVALDFLSKTGERYALTPLARKYLLKKSPTSYATMIAFMEQNFVRYTKLEEAVRTGKATDRRNMFQDDPKALDDFIGAMHDIAVVRGDAKVMARKLNLKPYRFLLDIGGGPGTYAIEFCKKNPKLKATVFDLPATCRVARRMLKKNDPTKRVSVKVGDYNKDPFPKGIDCALLSNVIHSENERDNQKLFKKLYRALGPDGQVLIKDHFLNQQLTAPVDGAVFSLTMLLFTRGRSYGTHEVKDWLKQAGFRKVSYQKMPAPMTSDIITAIK